MLRIYLPLHVVGGIFLFSFTLRAMIVEPQRLAEEYKPNTGNIIILMDQLGCTKSPDDALVLSFLYALDQGVAPILVSNSIWNGYVAARKDFYEEIKDPAA